MARTDAEHLAELKEIRDQLVDAIHTAFAVGAPINRYRIGNREVQRENLRDYLEWVRQEIEDAERDVNAASGPARNYARRGRF